MEKRLILASASPRRKELLTIAGYTFEIIPSHADEISSGREGGELARINAIAKARDIYNQTQGQRAVVGADTVVCLDNEILGKPKDEAEAAEMLKKLSGRHHKVITGFAIVSEGFEESGCCETEVLFKTLSQAEIDSYVATGEPLDKAGAYGIQERACLFAQSIKGDYFNIMGLPVAQLYPILSKLEVLPQWQKVLLQN